MAADFETTPVAVTYCYVFKHTTINNKYSESMPKIGTNLPSDLFGGNVILMYFFS